MGAIPRRRWVATRAELELQLGKSGDQLPMFITKRHLSRRTVLRGMGVAVGLPFLDAMVPAQTPLAKTAAVPRPRLCCIEMVHGAAGSTVDGSDKHYWSPAKEGADFEFTETARTVTTVPRIYNDHQRHRPSSGRRLVGRRRRGRPFPLQLGVPDRRASENDRGIRSPLRTLDRPDLRAAVRAGHADAVHPALHRERGRIGGLRLRLRLRLRGHHQLGLAHAAAADDGRSADGF